MYINTVLCHLWNSYLCCPCFVDNTVINKYLIQFPSLVFTWLTCLVNKNYCLINCVCCLSVIWRHVTTQATVQHLYLNSMYSKVKLNMYKIKKYQQSNWLDFRVTIQNSKNSDDTSHLHCVKQHSFHLFLFLFQQYTFFYNLKSMRIHFNRSNYHYLALFP